MSATKKQLAAFAREEYKTAQMYNRMGYHKQGRQESQHASFFKMLSKK